MKRPRLKTTRRNPAKKYIIDPIYIKAKVDLENSLKAHAEHKRIIDYCEEKGAKDGQIITFLHNIIVERCKIDLYKMEHPKILNGSPFLKENGYRDDLLDEFYEKYV